MVCDDSCHRAGRGRNAQQVCKLKSRSSERFDALACARRYRNARRAGQSTAGDMTCPTRKNMTSSFSAAARRVKYSPGHWPRRENVRRSSSGSMSGVRAPTSRVSRAEHHPECKGRFVFPAVRRIRDRNGGVGKSTWPPSATASGRWSPACMRCISPSSRRAVPSSSWVTAGSSGRRRSRSRLQTARRGCCGDASWLSTPGRAPGSTTLPDCRLRGR